jgi:hypothetical protein
LREVDDVAATLAAWRTGLADGGGAGLAQRLRGLALVRIWDPVDAGGANCQGFVRLSIFGDARIITEFTISTLP